jgi:hypothetical protein
MPWDVSRQQRTLVHPGTAGYTASGSLMPSLVKSSLAQKHSVRFRWLKVTYRYALHKYRLRQRGVPIGLPRGGGDRGGGEGGPGTVWLGKPVPVGPNSPHHLVGAKEFPPSQQTRSYPKD